MNLSIYGNAIVWREILLVTSARLLGFLAATHKKTKKTRILPLMEKGLVSVFFPLLSPITAL